jgi:SMODS domain-containing protein
LTFSSLPRPPLGPPLRTRAAIQVRFQKLLGRVNFSDTDLQRFHTHRESVTRRLRVSFATSKIFPIGSATRGSAIPQTSDLDLMLVLRVHEARWGGKLMSSFSVLNNVRAQLQSRYRRTDIGRDGQAIVVDFEDGQRPVDVVPAVFAGVRGAIPLYIIPDGRGGWITTSPALHRQYISHADERSGGKLKNVARMIKYWRWCRTPEIPLSSFHVELLMAHDGLCAGVKTYGQCLYNLFQLLSKRECRALQDPLRISGWVQAANTEAKRERAVAGVNDSAFHSAKALVAELEGDTPEAIPQWDIVFNGFFPKG